MSEDGQISWGKVLGGIAAVAGVAVAGVGLGGPALAQAIGDNAFGTALKTGATRIAELGVSAAQAVHISPEVIDKLGGGKGIAAIVGGAAAVAGGAAMAFSGGSNKPQDGQDQQLAELMKLLPKEAKAQLIQALQMAMSQSALPPLPGGKSQGR